MLGVLQPFVSSSDMQSLLPSAFLIFAAAVGMLAAVVAALATVEGHLVREGQLAHPVEAYGTLHGKG